MSVAAMAWAFRQCVPPKPKVILLALADQTDEVTGKVCYGRTDLDYIAVKCSIPRRTLTRYLGALDRNGYMRRESHKDRGEPSHYWLCLDRVPAKSIKEWSFVTEAGDDVDREDAPDLGNEPDSAAPQDADEGGPKWPTPSLCITSDEDVQNGPPGGPPDGPGVGHMDGPQESTTYQSTKASRASAPSVNNKSGFSKRAQDADRFRHAREREQAKPARYFVIEGTRAWDAWVAEMCRRTGLSNWSLTVWATVDGKQRRGWYFPSLFPPQNKSTAPPGELSDEDARALMG